MDRKSFRKGVDTMNFNSIGIITVSLFGIVACICCGEGCCEKREMWSDNSTNAMNMVTNLLQSAAECVGKPMYTDPKWKQLSRQCEKLDAQMFAVTDMRERLRLVAWIERFVYKSMDSQTNNIATLEFWQSSVRTIDSLANVLWESTSDNDVVWGVWERFYRKGRIVSSSCEVEWKRLEPEYRRLTNNSQYFAYKLLKVSMLELTPREKELFKEVQEKRWPTEERYRYLGFLVGGYRGQLVDFRGMFLDSGELYARFTQLSPEERDRLAAYTIEEYIARHVR